MIDKLKPKKVGIADFLTVEEAVKAMRLYKETSDSTFAEKCADEIIEPVIDRINAKLGQENHPLYLAYLVHYVFMTTKVKERINAV